MYTFPSAEKKGLANKSDSNDLKIIFWLYTFSLVISLK